MASELGIQQDSQGVQLRLLGDDGQEYSLEAVEAFLNSNATWRSVATVAPGRTPAFLYDPTCSINRQNFYRLRLLQGSVPITVPNFRLLDTQGRAHELFYQSDATAVVLILAGADPGTLEADMPELLRLRDATATRGVRFWILAVSSPSQREQLRTASAMFGEGFTVLEDEDGVVTRLFGRGTAPEAVAFDPATYSILYRGRIADRFADGANGGAVEQSLLGAALTHHLAGESVVIRETEPLGSPIDLPVLGQTTYSQDIAPLMQDRCVKCHTPDNIAPWAMTNYTVIRDFAPLMKDEVLTHRMPPWYADERPRHYSNDQMLTAAEIAMIVDWVDRGAPRGDGPDPLAEQAPPPLTDWPLGAPDRIVAVDTQQIPATGTIDYRYLVVANPYPTNVWLRAAVVRPGNRKVVHHSLVFSATSFSDILQVQAGLGGYFAAYVPGLEQTGFPEGTGKLLKKGAFLVFQMHYTATGEPQTDKTELGFYLASTPPARQLNTGAAYTLNFTLPPGDSEVPASAEFTLPQDAVLYEMSPHMHYRGKWFRFDAVFPDGSEQTLLNVPFYRFDWQTLYRLAEPLPLPKGTRIVATGAWDNSPKNPDNPDPGATVRFGEQSWDEMFIGYFNWTTAP